MNHRPTTAAAPDAESAFAPPSAWLPMRYPRRGGFAAAVVPVEPGADAELTRRIEGDEERLRWAAWDLENDPDPNILVSAARRYRDGDVSAVGAATLAYLLTRFVKPEQGTLVVDGWVARHGLPFAVTALLETSDIRRVDVPVAVKDLPDGVKYIWVTHSAGEEAGLPEYVTRVDLRQVDDPTEQVTYTVLEHMLDRMRGLLATAPEREYTAARVAAAALRTNSTRRLAATFLFPTEREWSREAIEGFDDASSYWRTHVLVSVNSTAELARVVGANSCLWLGDATILAAVVDGVGTGLTPVLTAAFDTPVLYRSADEDALRLRILHALSAIPTDDAFAALVDRAHVKDAGPAVRHATSHWPRRALRRLARSESGLFDRHVLEHPGLATDLADTLPARARRRIEELTATVPEATDLPPILVTPPWTNRTRPAAPTVIDGLTPLSIHRMAWLPGELEDIRRTPHDYSYTTWEQYRRYVRTTDPDGVSGWEAEVIFLLASDEIARPLLTDWETTELREPLRVAARYELEALPLLLRVARARPAAAAPYLMPFVDLDVARLHATMFATRKNLRKSALSWLVRHADDAVTLLVPDAVGAAGPTRDHATAALRALARATSRTAVVGETAGYGSDATDAVASLVDLDPLDMLPTRIPKTPPWADLDSLPPILTADRSATLPASAVSIVLTMCAVSTADAPYAGLDTVTVYCDRASLATALWELFERWWGAGAPAKDNWVVLAQGWLGDDTTVARLAPLIRRWPGEGGTARAQLGLDALAARGSARALTELDRISRKMRFKSLKTGAAQRVTEVAERLGLDREQLADRTVPDLDLTAEGTMVLDVGPRTFTVGFTEALVPYVVDGSGTRTSGLPRATATDDAELTEAAAKRFATLKRESKTVAAEQIKRFTRALVTGRRWDTAEFTEYVLEHPLLVNLARGLLWASFDDHSRPVVAFRVAAHGTLVDVGGHTVDLPDGRIGLVHPAHLPDTVAAWSAVFADHGIRQPFPQLDRPVHHPLPGDLDGSGLTRFTGVTASPSQALRLTFRGWEPVWENPAYPSRESPGGQGLRYRLNDAVSVLLGLDPGMGTGSPYDGYPDQTLVSVTLGGGTLADVEAATVSELLADLAGFAS